MYAILLGYMKDPFFRDSNGQTIVHICVRGMHSIVFPDTLLSLKALIRHNLYESLLDSVDEEVRNLIKNVEPIFCNKELQDKDKSYIYEFLKKQYTENSLAEYFNPIKNGKNNDFDLVSSFPVEISSLYRKNNDQGQSENFLKKAMDIIIKTKGEFDDYVESKTNEEFKRLLYLKDNSYKSSFDIIQNYLNNIGSFIETKQKDIKDINEVLQLFDVPQLRIKKVSLDKLLCKYKTNK